MSDNIIHRILSYFIAAAWLANGLFCKILKFVPRHQQIVGHILGDQYSRMLTLLIGLSEVAMAIWIISKIKTRLNAIAQMTIVAVMNTLEFILVPDLLLWGKFNSMYAALFILLVYYNEFVLNKKLSQQT